MNLLTQFKKIPILPLLIALALFAVIAPARATPSCGIVPVTLAMGHYPSGLLNLACEDEISKWELEMKLPGSASSMRATGRFNEFDRQAFA